MQKFQLKPYHPTPIVDLNEDDFDRCGQICEIWLETFNHDPGLVDHILWSNECKFNRTEVVNLHNYTHWSTKKPNAEFSMPNTEEGMMAWCGLSSSGLLGPHFFDQTVNGLMCRQVLVDYAWLQLRRKRLYFRYDRAAPHYAVIVM